MAEKQELIRQAIELLEENNRLILRYKIAEWLSLDLTITQLKSILYINSRGKVSFKELAGALNVTPSVVTGIADRLEAQGMVKRQTAVESTDRRIQWLLVTDKAKELLSSIRQETGEHISKILENMSEKDLAALIVGFRAFVRAAEPYLTTKHEVVEVSARADGL